MAKIRVWNTRTQKLDGEREIQPNNVTKISRFRLRQNNGYLDGVSVQLADEKGNDGERVLTNEHYSDVCRKLDYTPKTARGTEAPSTHKGPPANFGASKPTAVPSAIT